MNDKQIEKIKESIDCWEKIADGKEQKHGADDCPCCIEWFESDCEGCPIKESTGKYLCSGTPYIEFIKNDMDVSTEGGRSAARKMIEFLRSLLP